MGVSNAKKFLLIVSIIGLIGFFSYNFLLKDIILNNSTETIAIEKLKEVHLLHLQKQMNLTGIYGLEIEIKGTSTENLKIMVGKDMDHLNEQIALKKGVIEFQIGKEWYDNDCVLLIQNFEKGKGNLEIDYRFIGKSK